LAGLRTYFSELRESREFEVGAKRAPAERVAVGGGQTRPSDLRGVTRSRGASDFRRASTIEARQNGTAATEARATSIGRAALPEPKQLINIADGTFWSRRRTLSEQARSRQAS